MSNIFRTTGVAAAVLLAVTLSASLAAAQTTIKTEPIRANNDVSGAANFRSYCTPCHGVSGKGDGPAAKALKKMPADLTMIAQRHGGSFPFAAVKDTIKGQTAMDSHGSREMPMWGPVFRSIDDNSVTELRLGNLVKYIEGFQVK